MSCTARQAAGLDAAGLVHSSGHRHAQLREHRRIARISVQAAEQVEALLEAQIEAPRRLLGEPGHRQEKRLSTMVSATDPWLDPKLLDMVGDLTAWAVDPNVPVVVHRAPEATPVSLFMEDDLKEEVLLGLQGGALGLYFKPDLVLFPAGAGE